MQQKVNNITTRPKFQRKKKSLKNLGLSWSLADLEVVKRLLKAEVERGSRCTPPGASSARMFALSSTPPATAAAPAARAAFAARCGTSFEPLSTCALFTPVACALLRKQ